MKVMAYLRVSREKQDLDNQRFTVAEFCKAKGLALESVYTDAKSGKLSWRQRDLAKLLDDMQPGDVLVTPEVSRVSRSLQDIFDFLAEAARREIVVHVISLNLTVDGTLQSTVLVTAFGLAAEIERAFISQRTKDALQSRKSKGVILGRPKGRSNDSTIVTRRQSEIDNLIRLDVSSAAIARVIGCHAETIRRYRKTMQEKPATPKEKA